MVGSSEGGEGIRNRQISVSARQLKAVQKRELSDASRLGRISGLTTRQEHPPQKNKCRPGPVSAAPAQVVGLRQRGFIAPEAGYFPVMPSIRRVLDLEPVADLADHLARCGGDALAVAASNEPIDLIGAVTDAGLRGRGGAGFPTGVKWQTVTENRSVREPTAVIVNAAEGEPGTFKDRAILRANPYRVLEGALIAARAVGAHEVVVALKASFEQERIRVQHAIDELSAAGIDDVAMRLSVGPSAYLFGEESAMLEVVEGRQPFPRVTPPYRRGIDEGESGAGNSAATVGLAGTGGTADSPALVNNVETLANVPGIILNGPDWFREIGTADSPGSIVCTISGDTEHHGVGEFAMGTPLWEIIDELGGGPRVGQTLIAAVSGTANSVLEASQFTTPLTYEDMAAAGSGLGSAGFIVIDDGTDLVAFAQAVARFLAVESCGQCLPCKDDGIGIARLLADVCSASGDERTLAELNRRFATVGDGARCGLALQQSRCVQSLVTLGVGTVERHLARSIEPVGPLLVAPIVDLVDGAATIDEMYADKQPDWSYGALDSGIPPAELYIDTPVSLTV
ncbi:MAG: NADH-quinone oxidoreductase subunit F [Ilumatobacter sp.]